MNATKPELPNTAASRLAGSRDAGRRSRQLLLWATLVTLGLSFVPGSDFALYPLRLFVTFVHESGHAISAIVTGGSVDSLHVHPDGSGVTLTRDAPWWSWFVLSGGYLGAALVGAILLQVGRLTRWRSAGRAALFLAAGFILCVTLLWGRDPFTLIAGLLLAGCLWLLARLAAPSVARFLSSFLAVQCSLNALTDIRILLKLTTAGSRENDAAFMAQQYLLPATFWALLWAGIALALLVVSLRSYWRATAVRAPVANTGAGSA